MRATRTLSASETLLSIFMAFWHVLCTVAPGVIPCPAGRGPCQIGTRVRGMGRNMAAKEEFRHLDSNQDNRLQRTVGCQLPHAGQKPQIATADAANAAAIA